MNVFCMLCLSLAFILPTAQAQCADSVHVQRQGQRPDVSSHGQSPDVRTAEPSFLVIRPQNSDFSSKEDNGGVPDESASVNATAPKREKQPMANVDSGSKPGTTIAQPASLNAAWKHLRNKRYEQARKHFARWIHTADQRMAREARLGLAYTLLGQGGSEQARDLLAGLAFADYRTAETAGAALDLALATDHFSLARRLMPLLPPEKRSAVRDRIELAELREQVRLAPHGSSQERTALETLLQRDPRDDATRERLAWLLLEQGEARNAEDQFARLTATAPIRLDYLRGHLLALQAQNRIAEALHLAGTHPAEELAPLVRDLHLRAAGQAEQTGRHDQAIRHFELAAGIAPLARDDRAAWIWTLQAAGETNRALIESAQLYEETGDVAAAAMRLDILQAADNQGLLQAVEDELASSVDPAMRTLVARRKAARNELSQAAALLDDETTCYRNCDQPDLNLAARQLHKDGDAGLTRLDRLEIPAEARYPLPDGRMVRVGAVTQHLNTGSAPDTPYMGTYYRSYDGIQADGSNLESRTVWTPYLAVGNENVSGMLLEFGSTPLGGDVDPRPVFKLGYAEAGNFRIALHQCAVEETMLSYIGQQDPYSETAWGRVLRSGLELEKTVGLDDGYWLSFQVGADYYWGYNVEDNLAVTGGASMGKTFSWSGNWKTNAGLFSTVRHFQRNSNFQTYGHGGYFSPELFVMAGPFVRMTHELCQNWFVDAEGSVGLMHFRTADAPKYVNADAAGLLNADAFMERTGDFVGESQTGIGGSARIQAMRMLGSSAAFGGFAGIDTSSEYTQWQTGLMLRFFFDARNGLCDAQIAGPASCP